MNIYTIFFIFMITTSITMTGFVLRQKKNNRMLGELVAQSKVNNASKYSAIGVGVQNKEYVSKCPSCAEWIKLEAKICKACQSNVEQHNLRIKEGMKDIDVAAQIAADAKNQIDRDRRQALLKNPAFRGLLVIALISAIALVGIRIQSTLSYIKATAMPSSASELAGSWNSIVDECQFLGTVTKPKARDEDGSVTLSVQLGRSLSEFDWSTKLGKEILCFSDKALGIDVSAKLNPNATNNINLRNSFSIFGDYETSYIAFYWN